MAKKVSEDEKERNFHLVSEQLAQILSALISSPVLSKEPPGSSKAFLHSLSNIPPAQTEVCVMLGMCI